MYTSYKIVARLRSRMATRWVMKSGVHLVDFLDRLCSEVERDDEWKTGADGFYQRWTFSDGSTLDDAGDGLKPGPR